jgi:DNA-binding transcriptional LysR family regulator
MDLHPSALKSLVEVLKTGSFAEAARNLGYTPSAVSQQMAALERTLGIQLFERRSRSVHPTVAARYLQERSQELISLFNHLELDLRRLSAGETGRIRLGSFASAGAHLLAPAISSFLAHRADTQITLEEGEPHELVPRVAAGEIDAALVFRYDLVPARIPRDLRVTELLTEPLYVIASRRHRLAHCDTVTFAELADETWIANREDTLAMRCLKAMAAIAGFEPTTAFRINNFQAIHGLVRSHLGVALVPSMAYTPHPDLVVIRIAETLPNRHVSVVLRRQERSPLVPPFIDALQKSALQINKKQKGTTARRPVSARRR